MKDIKFLLNKYFEGQTSLEEEKILREFFQKDDIPEELRGYTPVFQYFADEIRNLEDAKSQTQNIFKPTKRSLFVRWTSLAAACLLILLCISIFFTKNNVISDKSVAYINGKKYTDINLISAETLRCLENISDAGSEARSAQIEALEAFTSN